MTYLKWFEAHAKKHKNVVDELVSKNYAKERIIEYFDFDNMVKNEKSFCLLYEENKKCHDIKKLNCFLCACPHFRFNDEGLREEGEMRIYSECSIGLGAEFTHQASVHHDCTSCVLPHKSSYVDKNFDLDWKKIMNESAV
jgi:hypothetical protein